MTNRPQPAPARSGRSCGCMLVALLVVALAGVYLYIGWLRPLLSDAVAGQLEGQTPGGPQQQLEEQLGQQGPTIVAALPSGELTITDQEVNDYLQANPDALRPLDSVSVAFTPDLVTAELQALGSRSTASTGLSVADGRLVAVNPQISGALGALVKADVIANALTQQLNNQLAAEGRRASAVRVEQGQLVITIE